MTIILLWWLIAGALLLGGIAITVNYVLTRYNIVDTIKEALRSKQKEALAKGFEAMVKQKGDKAVTLDVLISQGEKLEVTINAEGVDSSIYEKMKLYA